MSRKAVWALSWRRPSAFCSSRYCAPLRSAELTHQDHLVHRQVKEVNWEIREFIYTMMCESRGGVKDANESRSGKPVTFRVECGAPNALICAGWRKDIVEDCEDGEGHGHPRKNSRIDEHRQATDSSEKARRSSPAERSSTKSPLELDSSRGTANRLSVFLLCDSNIFLTLNARLQ